MTAFAISGSMLHAPATQSDPELLPYRAVS